MRKEEYQQKLQEVYDGTRAKDCYRREEIYFVEEMMEFLGKM